MKIPCFVISYNRPSFLAKCVEALSHEERLRIIIVDNGTIPETLRTHGCETFVMRENLGHTVVWNTEVQKQLTEIYGIDWSQPYIVTDCDIVVPHRLPWLDVLLKGMERLPKYNKFGLGLNTSAIPQHYPQREQVLNHENRVIYKRNIMDDRFIEAPVDTTLALYRAGYTKYSIWGNDSPIQYTGECKSVRTFAPYEAAHLTWHMTKEELAGDEHQNYCKTINKNSTHWSAK